MKLTVDKGYFQTKEDVFDDIRRSGFWPTTYISGTSPELPLHWHDGDIIGYVMEGETYLLDESGERVPLQAGDRLNIPAGAVHAEGEVVDKVVYIVTMRKCIPMMEGLTMLDPEAYPDPAPLELASELLAKLVPSSA
jgi:hypothetical protein